MGRVLGRLKRRPYGFCFYVVPLWVNGANGFYPSAPLGVTFVGCDKSNQKHAFKYGARKKRGDGFAGEKPHHASIAPTHKMVLSPVFRNTNPLRC